MLKLRAYLVKCPCCRQPIEILPPDSLVAERTGLTHRCSWCRRLLLTTSSHCGQLWIPEVRAIGCSDRMPDIAPPYRSHNRTTAL